MDNSFKNKKVLVIGLGINQGGLGVTRFFAKAGAEVRVTDLKPAEQLKASLDQLKDLPHIEYTLGEHRFEDTDWADLIIKNPGVKPGNPYIEYARSKGKQVEMDVGIFLQFAKPNQIIGITGTKGKSTTASLIYEILNKSAGVKPRTTKGSGPYTPGGIRLFHPKGGHSSIIFAGNIGKSVLDTIPHIKPDTLIILELSSFQLDTFHQHKVSPKWAVITNILPDHLNYYQTMEEYTEAKRAIAKYQTTQDFLFLNAEDKLTNSPAFLNGLGGKLIHFSPNDLPKNFHPNLVGKHNKANMAASLAVAKTFGIPEKTALEAVANFKGVEFRLQLIKEWKGVKIYNDTAATGPDAGIQALKTLPNSILIAGGVNKNLPYEKYAKAVDHYAKKVFFLEGDATEEIKKSMRQKEKIQGTYNNIVQVVQNVRSIAKPGDVILFSPAAASFNLFQNEFDRGRKFNQAVEEIFR